jgi:hypothetical protein
MILDGNIPPNLETGATTCISVSGGMCSIQLVDMTLAEIGKGRCFMSAEAGGYIRLMQDCSLNGWQNLCSLRVVDGSKFIRANAAGQPLANFVGSVTGKRYIGTFNSILNVGGGGPDFIPGTIAGTTSTNAQYA